jgi:hypothetical protein
MRLGLKGNCFEWRERVRMRVEGNDENKVDDSLDTASLLETCDSEDRLNLSIDTSNFENSS